MKDLDKIFREKLNTESATDFEARHPFHEDYWLAAERLIEAEQRRRRAWWWLLAATAGMLFGGYFLCKYWQPAPPAVEQTTQPIAHNRAADFSKIEAEKSVATTPATENFSKKATAPPTEQHQNFSKKETKNPLQSTQKPINQPEVISKNSPVIIVDDIRSVAGADEQSASGNHFSAVKNSAAEPATSNFIGRFWATPLLQALDFQKFNPKKQAPQPVAFEPTTVKKFKAKIWSFGAAAGAQWQPQQGDFGGSAGVFLQKKLAARWSIFAEARLRCRPDAGAARQSEQLKYDFGVAVKKFTLTRTAAFWLEMPLGVQFSNNEKLAFQLGLSPAILLGSRGKLESFEKKSASFESLRTASQRVWLDDPNYQKFYLSPFLGAELRLNRTFAANLRANFQPQNLELKNDSDGSSTPRMGIETGLKINLK